MAAPFLRTRKARGHDERALEAMPAHSSHCLPYLKASTSWCGVKSSTAVPYDDGDGLASMLLVAEFSSQAHQAVKAQDLVR